MLLDYDDVPDTAAVDVGPIIAAFVDSGLTVVHGERGVDRWPTPIAERAVPADLPVPLEIVRAPGEDAVPVQTGQPMSEDAVAAPAVEPVERLTFASIAALMRHKVEGRDGAPLGGGGGSGRRRTKPPKRRPVREVIDDEKPANVPMCYKVSGLTFGEQTFYMERPGEDLRVARETVGKIIRGEYEEPIVRPQRDLKYNFTMWAETPGRDGLKEPEIRILAKFRGALRRALIQNAHMVDGPRVRALDGIAAPAVTTKNAFGTLAV